MIIYQSFFNNHNKLYILKWAWFLEDLSNDDKSQEENDQIIMAKSTNKEMTKENVEVRA